MNIFPNNNIPDINTLTSGFLWVFKKNYIINYHFLRLA